jgi:hypothetical protein
MLCELPIEKIRFYYIIIRDIIIINEIKYLGKIEIEKDN